MIKKFQACRISRKDNILFPDELIVDTRKECITYRKFRIIGCDTATVSFKTIASVSIKRNILFADIVIETLEEARLLSRDSHSSMLRKSLNTLDKRQH